MKKTEQQFRDGEAAFWKFCWVLVSDSDSHSDGDSMSRVVVFSTYRTNLHDCIVYFIWGFPKIGDPNIAPLIVGSLL